MIYIENVEVSGWDSAIRGMRNPMNSWDRSDSHWSYIEDEDTFNCAKFEFFIGENDLALMKKLSEAGTDHSKFMRFINVTFDIVAPLYWWKEFDTYKVGTVANSCSTMHKITERDLTLDDFSTEHLDARSLIILRSVVEIINHNRYFYEKYGKNNKVYWWQMVQLLPSSYNQRRTIQLNYAVLQNMYRGRKNHKLDEWIGFCKWIESLPYSELITGENIGEENA